MTEQLEFHAMGSKMLAIVNSEEAFTALAGLPEQFEQWEQSLSRFRNDSELTALNRHAGVPMHVSDVLWDVFEASIHADQWTGGLVNPLIVTSLMNAGYDRDFGAIRASGGMTTAWLEAPPPVLPVQAVVRDELEHTLCLPQGAQLDFGGIAKGWAAQQAIRRLSAYGPALFSAGGDIAVSGPRADGEPWRVGVDDPFNLGEYVEMLYVAGGGVATSGKDYRRWMRAGMQQHHIIDPRTARPAETDVLTATVLAPDAMMAEAVAKAALILGSEAALDWLDSGDVLAGLLVLDDGRLLYSRNVGNYL